MPARDRVYLIPSELDLLRFMRRRLLGFVTWSICPAPIFGYHGPACLCSECISIGEDERDYRHGGDR